MPLFSVSENQGYSKELLEELLLIQFMLKVSENRKGKKPATQQTFLVFQDVFNVTLFIFQDVFKTTSRRICNTSSSSVFKTSSRRLQDVLQDVFKAFSRRIQDILQDVFKTPSTRLQDVFARRLAIMSLRRLEDKKCYTEDFFKTSSVRLHQDECLLGRFPVTTVNFMVCFLIITVQKFQ